ncbi:MAG: SDR family oxidoreductase [Gammaproteobacteria bacterium]|nr:SDR family oxidoreductase [Gammaproteobacteria bacterium]
MRFNSLQNQTFLVTGATSGIGRLLVITLVSLGANVAFCGRSEQKMASLLEELNTDSSKLFYETFDLTDFERIEQFVSGVISKFGGIDVLVNNAGLNSSRAKTQDLTLSDLAWMTKVNMYAPFVMMREVANQTMLAKKQGVIINIMSTVCQFSNEGIGAYTASKSGFDGLSKVFRKEVRESGIKVCNLYPGGVDTEFRESKRPLYLEPNDVVEAILFMAQQSDKASVDELVIRPKIEKNYS